MVKLGGALKKARLEKGLTLDDVAAKCGYSKALISRIENNNVSPSIDSLSRIAAALNLTLYDIFASAPDSTIVYRKASRQKFKVEDGNFELEILAPYPSNSTMLPIMYSGKPGSHSSERNSERAGQEWAIVLEGEVEVTVAGEKYLLKKGDSIYFNSGIPHRYENVGRTPAKGICVTTPPNY
ncbi:helix-turn-helix transcriptional regulator [Candidatus Poribacteria bacterium]|nr:helix-turn-helix transcriptional regulator [Candidatus Poribacteria bacterium]